MRKRHAVRRGRAVVKKTFGKVPVGGLFQLKDDPDNATLQKVSKAAYVVVTPGHPGRGIKYAIAANYPIKRGRQGKGKALRGRHKASRRGHARVALGPGDRLRRVPHPGNDFREDIVSGKHVVGYVEMISTVPQQYEWVVFEDDGIERGVVGKKSEAFEALKHYVRGK
jgi:hypothetical protein